MVKNSLHVSQLNPKALGEAFPLGVLWAPDQQNITEANIPPFPMIFHIEKIEFLAKIQQQTFQCNQTCHNSSDFLSYKITTPDRNIDSWGTYFEMGWTTYLGYSVVIKRGNEKSLHWKTEWIYYPLVICYIAMEAMAHGNRWFTSW